MNQQVTRLQFMFLMFWTIMGTGILTMPFGIAHFTIHDGWLVPIMFFAGSAISILVCAVFMHTFPSCTLTEGFERAFGPWIGRMLGVWMTVMMYIGLCMLLRELSLFLEINALPRTPMFVSTAVIVAPLGPAALLGIKGDGGGDVQPRRLVAGPGQDIRERHRVAGGVGGGQHLLRAGLSLGPLGP